MRTRVSLLLVLSAPACAGDGALAGVTSETDTSAGSETEALAPDLGAGGVPGPAIVAATPVSTPGSSVYVLTDEPIAGVEVRVGGALLAEPPILVAGGTSGDRGALFALPPALGVGDTAIAVRRRGDPADSDVAPLTITAPSFVDVAADTGLLQVHDVSGFPRECAWSSTGLTFGDYDGDGDSDFYVGNIGRAGRLMRNDGDRDGDGLPDFVEVTDELGLADIDLVAMAAFLDHDGDGDQDLFIGRRGVNMLMRNQLVETGAPGFVDVHAALGLGADSQRTMGIAWGDYDGDADLDLYVVNHAFCFPRATMELRAQDHLYRNDGGSFTEVTALLGTGAGAPVHALGFSAVWVDIERDGDQDLIVINDHIAGLSGPNALWRNDGPGPQGWRFTEVAAAAGLAIPPGPGGHGANGMGLAIGDVDHDGLVDLAFSNIGPNFLMLNRGDGTFRDVSQAAGIRRGMLPWQKRSITWAAHLFDLDNDADLDLYFSGGTIHDAALIPDALLRNDGGRFTEVTWAAGLTHLGSGKGSALVDLDRDGALEFATAHWSDRLRVYHNRVAQPGHWLVVELVGTRSHREALGSVVELEVPGGPLQTCFHAQKPALGAGGEPGCHFGLGAATSIARLVITWPDGSVSEPAPPAVDTRITVVQ